MTGERFQMGHQTYVPDEDEPERSGPCDRFRLDYYTDQNHSDVPNHRYCECGWTEAHHEAHS
jgi:hypothetical protein